MSQRRQPRSERTEAKAPPRRDLDLNKERLIFCLSSLIGHKVTAKLRGNVIYEGVFHSCALEGDFSIILKHARLLPSEQQRSGNVIDTLIIPGKDFLQVNAMDVATPDSEEDSSRIQGGAFATDGEITSKRGGPGEENRELVVWSSGVEGDSLDDGALGNHRGSGNWDQFEHNEKMFGVASTFNEEYYTTKLDPNSISPEKREMADRIAKEIESEGNHGDREEKDYDEDEEARFSAVQGTGAYSRKTGASSLTGSSSAAPSSKARGGRGESAETGQSSALSLPVPKAGTEQVDASQREREFQRADYRKQRGMVLTHSPMHSSMISEMKRINALNLEPAVPKLDDKTGSDWINFKQSQQARSKANPVQGDGLKAEFEQSLSDFKKREAEKKGKELSSNTPSSKEKESEQSLAFRKPEGNAGGSESTRSSSFKFNPNAPNFSFNANAASFTPGMTPTNASNTPAVTPSANQVQNSHQPVAPTQSQPKVPSMVTTGPQFITFSSSPELLRKRLDEILDGFFACSDRESSNVEPTWTDATGPSYKEVLGQPNPAMPMGQVAFQGGQQPPWPQPPIAGNMPTPGGPPPGQPGQPMMSQPGPFMMPQPAPGGQPSGQMFAQPMYPAPTGAPMQRPPAGGGNMPPTGQQPMAFQQGMVPQQPGPGQGGPQMPMHQGAPNQSNVMNMPKNYMGANMVMMVPAGQSLPQGFAPVPMQGQPGQQMQGQPGPGPQGNPQQGGQMMRPMYMPGGQMGGGPPHQMPSHDG